jgi:aspartate aminotransferase/aminotransferase
MDKIDSSAIRQAFSLAHKIKDPIDLSVGFPEDNTPDNIKEEAIKAIRSNLTRYTPSNGIKDLREALANKFIKQNNLVTSADQISILPGATTGILMIFLALLDPGDEIIIPDPFFPPYRDIALMLGAKPVFIDTAPSFKLTAEQVKRKITKKTKIIFINTPNNPTGAVYETGELKNIAKLAEEHGIIILSDEIYEHFSYESEHFSIGSIYKNTLTLNGFSKAYAMTGWRIGYVTGPKEIINAINELLQYTVFSTNSISQIASLAALNCNPKEMTTRYKQKKDFIIKELSPFFEIHGAQGAFYLFLKVPAQYKDDIEFINEAITHGLIILPGRAFSQHNSYFRIAFGGPMEDIKKGINIIKEMVNK